MKETRNSKVLRSFVKFCEAHENYRFWQCLLAWSGLPYILWSESPRIDENTEYGDTFYWEDKVGTELEKVIKELNK